MDKEVEWSVAVEHLVDGGDIEVAISLLESVISRLETVNSSSTNLELASALADLANLFSARGFSLQADELRTRASNIKHRAEQICVMGDLKTSEKEDSAGNKASSSNASPSNASASSDDDWEALADHAPEKLFSPQLEAGISKVSLEDTAFQKPKQRGRGTFLYKKNGLYSDQQLDVGTTTDSKDEAASVSSEANADKTNLRFGTSHVLVLADFPPSTVTIELEKLVEKFRDHGVAIRWVNDTVALAVFRTPSVASEALNSIHCSFTVRALNKNDSLLQSISPRDLEPPIPRPKTSVRTAQRLIAQGMGHKLPKNTIGADEFRKQEEARRKRIVSRQTLRDDAWGAD